MEIWHIVVVVCSLAALVLWRNRVPIRNWYRATQAAAGSAVLAKLPAVGRKSVNLAFWITLALVAIWIVSMPISCLQSGVGYLNARADLERQRMDKERDRLEEEEQERKERKAQQDVSVDKLDVPPEPEVLGPERTQMRSWWNKYGRPAPNSGWERMYTEVKVESSGRDLGMMPLVSTCFQDGYELEIHPLGGFLQLMAVFSDNVHLIDSQQEEVAALGAISCTGNTYKPIRNDTGLVWVQTTRALRDKSGTNISYTVKVVKPRPKKGDRDDAERIAKLVRDKRKSVCYAYRKRFTAEDKGRRSRICSLPLQLADGRGGVVGANFDLDITLACAPEPGENAVADPRLSASLLEENEDKIGPLMLYWTAGSEEFVHPCHISEWNVRLTSEDDVRPHLPKEYPYVDVWLRSELSLDVFVAIRIGGKKEHRL